MNVSCMAVVIADRKRLRTALEEGDVMEIDSESAEDGRGTADGDDELVLGDDHFRRRANGVMSAAGTSAESVMMMTM